MVYLYSGMLSAIKNLHSLFTEKMFNSDPNFVKHIYMYREMSDVWQSVYQFG